MKPGKKNTKLKAHKMSKNMKPILILPVVLFIAGNVFAQTPKPSFSISGSMGITYEGYGLTVNPKTPSFYQPRRPWNQLRFNIAPQIKIGNNFSLPLNFNFATRPTNFAGPYAGIGALGNQNFMQFISNPMNNFSIRPKYKWAELQLGTQYLNYSELSTGDIGVFGAGFDLKPKGYIIKFFTGTSQRGINSSLSPLIPGAFKRNNWMAQIGKEKEGKYKLAFSAAKGKDLKNSVTSAPSVNPQEGFVLSLLTDLYFKKGYYLELEGAQSLTTANCNLNPPPPPGGVKSFQPFIVSNPSTIQDYAATASIGKKSTNFDIGLKGKYLGAGFFTMGYPYQQPDRMDVTVNTRFNAWKDSLGNFKMNVAASLGERINNMSNTGTRNNQFIGNLNWFTQFSEKWNLNLSYNNFGFNANGSTIGGIPSIKNVSNVIGVNPSYTWRNTKMSNMLSLNYSYSKYDETTTLGSTVTTTNNNTHTALLMYVPTFFTKKIRPDFSVMYFLNQVPAFKMQLLTISCGLGAPLAKDKINLQGQVQYTLGKFGGATSNNNLIGSLTIDYAITKKLNWNTFLSTNYFKYGNELGVPLIGANYLESTYRTGLRYRWK
jgi:hypothetical protein